MAWVPLLPDAYKSYKFEHENITVAVCPLKSEVEVLSVGLPVIPFVPALSRVDRITGRLSIRIGIESPTDSTRIDLTGITATFPGGKSLTPITIKASKENGPYPSGCSGFKYEDIQEQEIVVTNGRMYFNLEFDISFEMVDEFVLDLGSISVSTNTIRLPPLQYRRTSRLKYHPFFMPLPS